MAEIHEAIRKRIEDAIDGAQVVVEGGSGGHFALQVEAAAFEGKNTLARHRMVLGAIADLMAGDAAPVHAIDSIETRIPPTS